jgi:hypothetical protein
MGKARAMDSGEGSADVCLNSLSLSLSLSLSSLKQAGSRRKKSACNECALFDNRDKEVIGDGDGARRTNAREWIE